MKELGECLAFLILVTALCFFVKPVETARFFASIVNSFNGSIAAAKQAEGN